MKWSIEKIKSGAQNRIIKNTNIEVIDKGRKIF